MQAWVRAAVVAALSGLCACAGPMDVPKVVQRPALDVARDGERFTFAGTTSKIPYGARIAEFPAFAPGVTTLTCGRVGYKFLEWGDRISQSWSGGLGEVFYETMRGANYNPVGDPNRIFGWGDDRDGAHFAIGARLVDIRGNFCEEAGAFRTSTGEVAGEFYVKVAFEAYSTLERRVVRTFVEEGYGKTGDASPSGMERTLRLAFASAAANLAADPGFADLVARNDEPVAERSAAPPSALTLAGPERRTRPLAEDVGEVLDAVVTVRSGGGHGSGFFISHDGYGLTNQHVVGEAETVVLRLRSGIEIEAKVVRADRVRDVALFKAPIQVARPLAVASGRRAAVLDEVYAIGSPSRAMLESTVTKGVVSAWRRFRFRGADQLFVQADAEIAGGNSGGPLVDARGNVVGMSDLGIGDATFLNLFIPIGDALEKLHLTVDARRK